jgi:hypothetical protein
VLLVKQQHGSNVLFVAALQRDVHSVAPCNVQPRPEVLLYALMSPAGCFTDFHVDFGGSSVWYHVVSGRKVFLAFPPTAANTSAFERWASSEEQASSVQG